MSVEQINKIYDEMYNNKYNSLLNSKTQALNNVANQEKEAETNAYDYRNQAASQNAMNTQQTRDWMAKNNLLSSGENVDALSRNQASYTNNLGTINSNLQKYKNQYATDRNTINSNFENDANTYKGQVESERAKALYDYQEKLRQEELQRQLSAQAAARSYSSGSGSSSYSNTAAKTDVNNEVAAATRGGDPTDIQNTIGLVTQAYQQGIISDKEYNNYLTNLSTSYRVNTTAQEKINNGTYGYSQARR